MSPHQKSVPTLLDLQLPAFLETHVGWEKVQPNAFSTSLSWSGWICPRCYTRHSVSQTNALERLR